MDLNLLPVLQALLRYRSVTLAARELDMSQSALSAALARLRLLLGDALFVRTGRGLLPTPRCEALAVPLDRLLEQLEDQILRGSGFEPTSSQRSFTVCLSDVGSYVLWPRLVRAVQASASGVGLRLRTLSEPLLAAALESGEVDIAVGAYPGLPGSLLQRRLFERDYVCAVRASHPLAGCAPTPQAFAEAAQVVVRLASGVQDQVDAQLAAAGLVRRNVLEIPSYLILPSLLLAGDYLAVVPGQLANAFAQHMPLSMLPIPLALPSTIIRLHWHRRFHEDAGHVWLRDQLVALFGD